MERNDFETEEHWQAYLADRKEQERQEAERKAALAEFAAHIHAAGVKTKFDNFAGSVGAGTAFDYLIGEIVRLRNRVARLEENEVLRQKNQRGS